MLISIIVSMYRTDQHLKRFLSDANTLSGVLTQAKLNHEIILVVNDATELEKKLLGSISTSFKTLFVGREPIYASWNRGLQEAKGEFVTFWGVDDTRYAQAIIDGVKNLQEKDADYTYFPFRYYRFVQFFGLKILAKIKTFTPPEFNTEKFKKEMHSGPHFMVRRSLFGRIGFFDDSFRIAGDFEFQARAAREGARFARTLSISGIFRNDCTTLSGSRSTLQKEESKRIYKQNI